jgi:hypothetical protein
MIERHGVRGLLDRDEAANKGVPGGQVRNIAAPSRMDTR